jgi:hypothetical protein
MPSRTTRYTPSAGIEAEANDAPQGNCTSFPQSVDFKLDEKPAAGVAKPPCHTVAPGPWCARLASERRT